MPSNQEIARVLEELVELMTMAEGSKQAFRVRAYEKAVAAVHAMTVPAEDLTQAQLLSVPGIGKSTAAKIREYVDTGEIARVVALRKQYPPELMELTRIPGLGPKTVVLLRDRLGIDSVAKLEQAIADRRLEGVPGLGEKSQEKIATAIQRLGLHGKDKRTPIAIAMPIAEQIYHILYDGLDPRRAVTELMTRPIMREH